MSEPALKCENNACFKQIYPLKLFIAFKVAIVAVSDQGEIQIFENSTKKVL